MSLLGPLPYSPLNFEWPFLPLMMPPLPLPMPELNAVPPGIDLIEKENTLTAIIRNPHIPLESIQVTQEGQNLVIRGNSAQAKSSANTHRENQQSFYYSQSINASVDVKHIQKRFSDDGQSVIITLQKKK